MNRTQYILFVIFFNILIPCAVCYGATDDPMANGMNNAVLFLLGVISFILLSIVGSIIHFYKRSKSLN
ncbi:MAG: hypothetical protein CMG24_05520 [Candidatus Marinimicrobia bacterium]|nr:hypothetical protein [Candidatus Neomarinimicrobiota bacterium]|tara:strand:+ start:161 stop:364 length:204 start_codon:yes stop_codon:yes gene_type:complete